MNVFLQQTGQVSVVRRRLLAGSIAASALSLVSPAWADLRIEITGVGANQMPIAIPPFEGTADAPLSLASVVGADLTRSGAFRLVQTGVESLIEEVSAPNFAVWAQAGANVLVTGSIHVLADGRWDVRYALYDTVSGSRLDNFDYVVAPEGLRMIAHHIADRIYTRMTGEGAFFSSRLVYVAQRSPTHFELIVADSDGANPQVALKSSEPIISPCWAPDGNKIAYVSFENHKPIIYVHDLSRGVRRVVANFSGNNSAPAFSPDGHRMAMALSRDGLTQIYIMGADGTNVRRFSRSYGIDTEPCFTPDGQFIYFTSDRGGTPQIYRQSLSNGIAERVTFGSDYAISPDVSPDGKKLAYISRLDGRYRVAVMDLQSGQDLLVTNTGLDESPSFAPNSRFLVYATEENGRGVLGTASADARLATRLTGEGNIREPSWGPVLP